MEQYTITVSPKTADVTLLRLLSPAGQLIGERTLDRAEVERFAGEVERRYRVVSAESPGLAKLGQELFEWLDGAAHRWLASSMAGASGMTLRIDVAEGLRHLPWELLHADGALLCFNAQRPFTPARLVTNAKREARRENRPLRLLFMACSAEDVRPLLDFEGEERMILESARSHRIELFVEESGSLEGLGYQVTAYGPGHFDVFHLTGHADVRDRQPVFLMENDQGFRREVSADEIAEAFEGNWPRLVWLSGCKTGEAPDQGALPSLCEALVRAGAPAVLGWALPVGDIAASQAAAELYEHLAAGKSIDEAVARARRHLLQEKNPFWHLLRLYTDATPLDGLVTAPKTPGRARLRTREAASEFFDAGARVEVCRREDFVGRRRPIQRCLRVLQSQEGDERYAEGILLHGMGGLGKSSLAARLCERMHGYRRLVFVGALNDETLDFTGKISGALDDPEAIAILNEPRLTLTQRLRNLFRGPLATQPALFVFDDFEQNLDASGSGQIARPAPLAILTALLTAIRDTNSESRAIVTCRYQFPLPSPLKLYAEGLESLRGGELTKKLTRMNALHPTSSTEPSMRDRAIALGAGNPRLLEWLDRVLADGAADATAIMNAMDREAERFREDVLLRELLGQLPSECRRLIALAGVHELPVDRTALAATVALPLAPHLERAAALGLIESGTDPATAEARYFVSRVTLPLVETAISDEERIEAAGRAARHLHQARWRSEAGAGQEEGLEIFRLALISGEREISAEIGGRIGTWWVNANRFREAEWLCEAALRLGDDPQVLLTLGRARTILGRTSDARTHYETALSLCPDEDTDTRSGILYNLAILLLQQGDVGRALELWQQSLALKEQIGDVKGKAATLANMAWLAGKQGNTAEEMRLNIEAGRALASIRAWLDLITVLGNLGVSPIDDAPGFLAQSLWLAARVQAPIMYTLNLAAGVFQQLGPDHDLAPHLGTAALFFTQTRGQAHPEKEKLAQYAFGLIAASAEAREIPEDQFEQWFLSEGLNDPNRFLPVLFSGLEPLIPEDQWLFDRRIFGGK